MLAQREVSEEQEGNSQTILLARRTRTIKLCSSDARSEGQSGNSPGQSLCAEKKQRTLARPQGEGESVAVVRCA